MSYATVEQYEARFGAVSNTSMLQECLDDCTAVIDSALNRYGINPSEQGESYADILMRVCRSMANRVYPSDGGDIPQGATSFSETAGVYSQSFSFATTYGTPKILGSELALLGVPNTYIGAFEPKIDGWYGGNDGD